MNKHLRTDLFLKIGAIFLVVYYVLVKIHKFLVNYESWFSTANNCCCKGESGLADEADVESSRGENVEMNIMNMTPEGNNDVVRSND